MGDRIANPKALGFAAFGIIAWMYSMLYAGWYAPDSTGTFLHQVASFAAIAMLIAALAAFLRNETWYAVFFMFWAAVIWGYRTGLGMGAVNLNAYGGWYGILIALVSLFLLLAAVRVAAGVPVVLLNLGNALAWISWALAGWLGTRFWAVLGGYIGLVTALAAFWAAWVAFGAMGGEETKGAA